MPLQRVPINNFRGGLNTRDGPFDLQPNESPDLLNVTLTSLVGQLQVRAGKTAHAAPPGVIDHCRQVVLNGTHFLMASIGGKIYAYNGGSNSWTAVLFTGTAATVWDFAQMPDAVGVDKVWCCNGVDQPQKWDGVAGTSSSWPVASTSFRAIVWQNKMVLLQGPAGTTLLQATVDLSKTGDPEATTGAYDTLQLRGDDDELGANTELNVLGDYLYIFKERSVWRVTDPSTFNNRRIDEPGCTGRFMSDVSEGKLYFFNEQGLWSTGGVSVTLETGAITNYFPAHLNLAAISKVRVIGTRDSYPRVLVALPVDGSSTNNILLELVPHINFRRIGGRRYLLLPAFMLHTFTPSSLAPYRSSVTGQWGVWGGDATLSKLYSYFDGVLDDGATISAHWVSSWMAIQGEEPFERIRRLNIELSGDVTVSVYKDFNVSPDFTALVTSDSTWDGGTWDGGQWDTAGQYRFARVRPESRGRFHQIRFDSVPTGTPFLINVAELAVRGGKEH